MHLEHDHAAEIDDAGPAPAARPTRGMRWFRGAFLTILYAAVAALVLNSFQLKWGLREDFKEFSFTRMVAGTADKPIAYRVLVPRLASAIAPLLPEKGMRALREHNLGTEGAPKRASVIARYGWNPERVAESFVAYWLQFASLVVVLVVSRKLVREVLGYGPAFCDLAPAVGLLFLPLTFHRGGYVYDFTELAFCAVGMLLLVRRRIVAWYVCFALACLNKESDVLLALQFAAFGWRSMSLRRLVAHGALHVAIGSAILLGLWRAFAGNPGMTGGSPFLHLPGNIANFGHASTWLGFIDIYAPFVPFPRPFNLVTLAIHAGALGIAWREKPWELRWAFGATMAALIPLFLVAGYRDEVRNFSLAFVPYCLLVCHTVHRVYAELGGAGAGSPAQAEADVSPSSRRRSAGTSAGGAAVAAARPR